MGCLFIGCPSHHWTLYDVVTDKEEGMIMKPPLIPKLWTLILIPLVMLGAGVSVITKDDPNYWLLVFIILWFVWWIYDHTKGRD